MRYSRKTQHGVEKRLDTKVHFLLYKSYSKGSQPGEFPYGKKIPFSRKAGTTNWQIQTVEH